MLGQILEQGTQALFLLLGVLAGLAAEPEHSAVGTDWWVPAGVLVALFTAFVALFKDEFWHRRHAPTLAVDVVDERGWGALELRLRNESRRMAAHHASVRVTELEPHPIEYAIGPKWVGHVVTLDALLPRASGETTYEIAPGSEVRLPFAQLMDGLTDDEAAVAVMPWAPQTTVAGEERAGMLVLPSAAERAHWTAQHPELAEIMGSPAMVRLEVAATNVVATSHTLKLWRSPDHPPADQLPMNPSLRAGVFRIEFVVGKADGNRARHASALPLASEP